MKLGVVYGCVSVGIWVLAFSLFLTWMLDTAIKCTCTDVYMPLFYVSFGLFLLPGAFFPVYWVLRK